MADLFALKQTLESLSLGEALQYVAENYQNVVFSTSFGQEDQVITDAIYKNNPTNALSIFVSLRLILVVCFRKRTI
jgi:phosphoadenosine phosphosulfate reductase